MSMKTGKPWTDADIAFLIESYPVMGRAWTARKLNRTLPSVDCKSKKLGLRAPGVGYKDGVPGVSATIRELIVDSGSVGASSEELIAATPDADVKSRSSILYHMAKNGQIFAFGPRGTRRFFAVKADGERWNASGRPLTTREQAEAAREAAREKRREKIKAQRLAEGAMPIIRGTLPKEWTADELDILRKHYPTLGAVRTASMLDRTYRAVRARAQKLGISCETNIKALNVQERRAQELEALKSEATRVAAKTGKRLARHQATSGAGVAPNVTVKSKGPFDESIPVTYHPNFKFTSKAAPPPPLRTNTHSVF